MKSKLSLVLGALFLAGISTPIVAAVTIDFAQNGFQIDAMDSVPSSEGGSQLMMFLPATEDFAPNVNVMIQPYAGAIKDYVALSKGQFESMKLTIISERLVGEKEWIIEYKGPMQGKELHFYARAITSSGKVYLATATAMESQWERTGAILRQNVNSFRVK